MKHSFILIAGAALTLSVSSCKENSRYVDPNSGRTLSLVKDASTGLMVDEETKKPVYMYVDTETRDTIYGPTGKVINGDVILEDGRYKYTDNETKVKSGDDFKMEVEKDGDVTIKDGNKKIKYEGETGETKVKKD
jgi:hypothetical protein